MYKSPRLPGLCAGVGATGGSAVEPSRADEGEGLRPGIPTRRCELSFKLPLRLPPPVVARAGGAVVNGQGVLLALLLLLFCRSSVAAGAARAAVRHRASDENLAHKQACGLRQASSRA